MIFISRPAGISPMAAPVSTRTNVASSELCPYECQQQALQPLFNLYRVELLGYSMYAARDAMPKRLAGMAMRVTGASLFLRLRSRVVIVVSQQASGTGGRG